MQEITLLLHFVGLGLLATALLGGIIIHRQYRAAPDLRAKALILKAGRPLGLLGPVGTAVMLITGIGNMHSIGAGLLTLGWLSAKIALFAVTAIAGIFLGIVAKKRGALVHAMSLNDAGDGAEARLASYDRTLTAGQNVQVVVMLGILYLSAIGRTGAG